MSDKRRKQYKDYIISARPEFLIDYQKWHIGFSIEKHAGSHVSIKPFYLNVEDKTLFDSEEDAMEQCFVAGAQTIDKGIGLDDM